MRRSPHTPGPLSNSGAMRRARDTGPCASVLSVGTGRRMSWRRADDAGASDESPRRRPAEQPLGPQKVRRISKTDRSRPTLSVAFPQFRRHMPTTANATVTVGPVPRPSAQCEVSVGNALENEAEAVVQTCSAAIVPASSGPDREARVPRVSRLSSGHHQRRPTPAMAAHAPDLRFRPDPTLADGDR